VRRTYAPRSAGTAMATVSHGGFEWDDDKSAQNARKHGVAFFEAMECFLDPHGIDFADEANPDRLILLAVSRANRVLAVVYAERLEGATIRIISARCATAHEEKTYFET
jgi:uncharacterized DUF497 family protein